MYSIPKPKPDGWPFSLSDTFINKQWETLSNEWFAHNTIHSVVVELDEIAMQLDGSKQVALILALQFIMLKLTIVNNKLSAELREKEKNEFPY